MLTLLAVLLESDTVTRRSRLIEPLTRPVRQMMLTENTFAHILTLSLYPLIISLYQHQHGEVSYTVIRQFISELAYRPIVSTAWPKKSDASAHFCFYL